MRAQILPEYIETPNLKTAHKSLKMRATGIIIVVFLLVLLLAGVLALKSHPHPRFGRGIFGGGELAVMMPAGANKHTHTVELDEGGSGVSSKSLGHRHRVADMADSGPVQKTAPSHRHKIVPLSELIVDA